ncbi:alanine racemase C-terminal domain-containing protein [Hungatella hathewayi]
MEICCEYVKDVNIGENIGYGRTYHIQRNMKVATIPTGYADGYSRLLSNKGYVLINGLRAPIVERICMDQMMADVTDIPNVHLGTEVVLIGTSGKQILTVDDMAEMIGTIGYEIIYGISKRVERIYVD